MLHKKSQATIFMILGVVLVIIFGFLFYISSLNQSDSPALATTQNLVKRNLLESFVSKCLERTATDALTILSQQGGKIHIADSDPSAQLTTTQKILYGISVEQLPSYVTVPYPFELRQRLAYPYFGKDNLPALCSTSGPNAIKPEYQACLTYSATGSIQEQLKQYVDQNMESCTDLETLFEDVQYQSPNTEVIMGENNIIFSLSYPINYTVSNQIYKIDKFIYTSKVRLKSIHEFTKSLIINEVTNPDFAISNPSAYQGLAKYMQGFIADKNVKNGYSIISIKDINSIIDGHTFVFLLAIQNREPIIKDIAVSPAHLISTKTTTNIIFNQPVSLEITPIVSDPDDDIIQTSIQESLGTIFAKSVSSFFWQYTPYKPEQFKLSIYATDTISAPVQRDLTLSMP